MQTAAKQFVGMHDFRSFTDDDPDEKSTKVEVEELRVEEHGDLILIRMRGSHFVWKMVRRVVGVLAEVGRGSLPAATIQRLLQEESDLPAKLTAPPSGLFLERVYYQDEQLLTDLKPVTNITYER
jgi:tRNA pseudouridine38-40 synthase